VPSAKSVAAKSVVTRSDEHPTRSPARRLKEKIGFMRLRSSQSTLPDRLFLLAAKGLAQFGFLRVGEVGAEQLHLHALEGFLDLLAAGGPRQEV
jgi:hypothetical protein